MIAVVSVFPKHLHRRHLLSAVSWKTKASPLPNHHHPFCLRHPRSRWILNLSLLTFLTNDDFRQERLAQLELLDERRLTALDHLQIYQKRIKRAYDKRLHERTFK
ncbi:hypothetical protein KI387_021672, partial [Taxus chinensis]